MEGRLLVGKLLLCITVQCDSEHRYETNAIVYVIYVAMVLF
jgi:hypothetical protein